jgi:hypothetical protein
MILWFPEIEPSTFGIDLACPSHKLRFEVVDDQGTRVEFLER